MLTALVHLILYITLIGLLLYVVETYLPLAPPIRMVLRVVAVLIAVVLILRLLGLAVW